jgi:hypothetical protein
LNTIGKANDTRERAPFPLFPSPYDHLTGGFLTVQQDVGGSVQTIGVLADIDNLLSASEQLGNDLLSNRIYNLGQLQGNSPTVLDLLNQILQLEQLTEKVANELGNIFGVRQ